MCASTTERELVQEVCPRCNKRTTSTVLEISGEEKLRYRYGFYLCILPAVLSFVPRIVREYSVRVQCFELHRFDALLCTAFRLGLLERYGSASIPEFSSQLFSTPFSLSLSPSYSNSLHVVSYTY